MLIGEAILLAAVSSAVVSAESPDPYARPQLDLLVGAASHRPLDGLDYFGGDGVIFTGLRFSIPEGFFIASQLLYGKGNGRLMPGSEVATLESAAGWATHAGAHGFAIELQDYRNHVSAYDRYSHNGVAAHYRHGNFRLEVGVERDQSWYYRPLDRFFDYDTRRIAVAQEFPVSRTAAFGISIGSKDVDRIELHYRFFEARFRWHWQGFDWQLAYNHASDDVKDFYPPATDTGFAYLRISRRFSIFPDP